MVDLEHPSSDGPQPSFSWDNHAMNLESMKLGKELSGNAFRIRLLHYSLGLLCLQNHQIKSRRSILMI